MAFGYGARAVAVVDTTESSSVVVDDLGETTRVLTGVRKNCELITRATLGLGGANDEGQSQQEISGEQLHGD